MAPAGQKWSYDLSENHNANDRFQGAALIGRRALKRAHSPKRLLTILRRCLAPYAGGTYAALSTELNEQATGGLRWNREGN